ncbi:hypothetical protein PanWU01x14_130260 [Parasponia andersonii]|uniref:Uncharacterized protein n=1 Tax=Parasponia andersonii TaxID=3476 RepID=A0A2P5CRB8_PARAD|nr:hypothetical protein PanWU01x14_130260 [Parasponia andersonii]
MFGDDRESRKSTALRNYLEPLLERVFKAERPTLSTIQRSLLFSSRLSGKGTDGGAKLRKFGNLPGSKRPEGELWGWRKQ